MENEPPIDEQVGGAPSTRGKRRHENPSLFNTKFRELEGYEFWITPYNRIFLVEPGGSLTHPRIGGGRRSQVGPDVIFDPLCENVPLSVLEILYALLEKQDAVRSKMVEDGEYDNDSRWDGWETEKRKF